jgi:hypothetical protein
MPQRLQRPGLKTRLKKGAKIHNTMIHNTQYHPPEKGWIKYRLKTHQK